METRKSILSDEPLENPFDDRLGYAPFAKELSDVICSLKNQECLVFALTGPWGSGKTTCINFVLHYINEKPESEKPLLIRFTPWWFSGREDLLKQFFKEIFIALRGKKEFKKVLDKLADFFATISEIPEPTVKAGAKITSMLLKRVAKDKEASKQREEVKKLIKKVNKSIMVIIDDIDRLEPAEIRSLFRVIKAIADFPNTIYLLAYDKDVVVKAFGNKKELSDDKYGEYYLEKIVQIPISLPAIDKTALRKLFFEELNLIFSGIQEDQFNQTYFGNIYWDGVDHFLNKIRDIKRLINVLSIMYPIVRDEVNIADFLAIRTLEIFSSDIYNLIRSNPNMFTGDSDGLGQEIDDIKAFHNKWLEQLDEKDREPVKDLLRRMFPKLEYVFGGSLYGSDWLSTWRRDLRICSPEIFPVYFKLSVPEGEISNLEMKSILDLIDNEHAFSEKLIELSKQRRPDGLTRLAGFLERMIDYADDIPKGKIKNALSVFYDIGDKLLVPEDESTGLFSFGNDIRIGRIMHQLIRRFETPEERFNVLKDVFSKGNAVYMVVHEVITLGQQHGKYGGQKREKEVDYIVTQKQLEDLERIALTKIKEAATSNMLLNTPHFPTCLYRWKDWDDIKKVQEWVNSVIKSDEGLVNFLSGFLSKIRSWSVDDRAASSRWVIDPKAIEVFISPNDIIERCRSLISLPPHWLNEKGKIALKAFIIGYDKWINGKDPTDFIDD